MSESRSMQLEMSRREMPVVFASANFAGHRAMFRPISYLGEFAQLANFDGVEVHPIVYRAKAVGQAAKVGDLDLHSLHQSFLPGSGEAYTNTYDSPSLTEKLRKPAMAALMPKMGASAAYMRTVQQTAGIFVPGIFYPQQDEERDLKTIRRAHTSEALFQPTDHVAQHLLTTSVPDMLRTARNHGYDGVCLDTFHMRRRYGREVAGPVSNLNKSLRYLAHQTRAVHLSLNRTDSAAKEPHIPTEQELRDALNGTFTGETANMLDQVKHLGDPKYVVVELTLGALKQVTGHRHMMDHAKSYDDIGAAVKAFFA